MPETSTKSIPARRNRQYERRLGSILKAAAEIIANDGFEGASVRKVAARAGIGLSGIYYYFKSKDEMLFAMQENTFSMLVNSLERKLKIAHCAPDRLKAVIDNHLQFFSQQMNDLKVCSHEIESLSGAYYDEILKIRREYYKLVRDVINENIPGSGCIDANLAALFLFGSLNWMYMWYDRQRNPDLEGLSNQLLKIFLEGIKAT
ncbi:MAG: TetR/AcrR family transcriptional regulator [candidate division Zixibacteria bacterium]